MIWPDEISPKVYEIIEDNLHMLGIPSHHKGFMYIRDIIILLIYNDKLDINLNKDLYCVIEKKYHTKKTSVERNIRYAIDVGSSRANYEYQEKLFRNSVNPLTNKQSNKEFLITLANRLKLGINKNID